MNAGDASHEETFNGLVNAVVARVPCKAIILFGSRARGDAGLASDHDILIIADFIEEFLDRGEWIVNFTPAIPVDLFCYTPDEFELMFSSFHVTALDAIQDGIILFGEAYVEPYKVRYRHLVSQGLRRLPHAILPPGFSMPL